MIPEIIWVIMWSSLGVLGLVYLAKMKVKI